MKKHFPGLIAFLLVWFLSASEDLSGIWRRAWNAGSVDAAARPSPGASTAGDRIDTTTLPDDTAPVPDPFRSAPAPPPRDPAPVRTDLGVPPPPRLWHATGRVGERAAVLGHPDGRVLVVVCGTRVDSAAVVSIGADGVVLEDRVGRFVLHLP